MESPHALVIEISRGTTHDGPGMRTTVFFKGCPLHCQWCQNPESIAPRQEIWWEARKCIRCLACIEVCQVGAVVDTGEGISRDRSKCTLCGTCVEECPAKASAFVAQEWQVEYLVKEVLKDRAYFQAFSGGVTVSGGEPLFQARFVTAFFRRLKEAGIHTALDTCGLASPEAFRAVLPDTDHVLFDLKLFDQNLHRQYTGQSNELILDNLRLVAAAIRASRAARDMKLWIRTPLIPEVTATVENIAAISHLLHNEYEDVVERWELCAFNPACRSKYHKMDLPWAFEDCALMDQAAVETLKDAAIQCGFTKEKLVVSGLIANHNSNRFSGSRISALPTIIDPDYRS